MTVMQKRTVKDVALLSNGSYDTGKGQAFDDYLWDTNFIPATARLTQFFKTNIGASYGAVAGDAKTEVETSMDDSGKLPAGQSFLINALCVSLLGNSEVTSAGTVTEKGNALLSAYKLVMNHSVWEIKFSNVEYSWRDSGSIFLPSIMETPSIAVQSADTGIAMTNTSSFGHYNWIKVSTKVPISELVSFSVNCSIDSGAVTVKAKVDDALAYLEEEKCEWRVQLKGLLLRKV